MYAIGHTSVEILIPINYVKDKEIGMNRTKEDIKLFLMELFLAKYVLYENRSQQKSTNSAKNGNVN